MEQKNQRDVLNKAAWLLVEGIKGTTSLNLTVAFKDKQLEINDDQLQKLMIVVNASIEEGYQRGLRTFLRMIEQAWVDPDEQALRVGTKKR